VTGRVATHLNEAVTTGTMRREHEAEGNKLKADKKVEYYSARFMTMPLRW